MAKETNQKVRLLWETRISSKLNTLKTQILRKWGMLFRTLFISSIGIIAYLWLEPQNIGDVPFSELTFNQIFSNLFFTLVAIGCLYWFFKFPVQDHPDWPNDNPYESWGWFGAFLILIVSVVALLVLVWIR